jgi:DNA-binding CsgD family transcriptional regulator
VTRDEFSKAAVAVGELAELEGIASSVLGDLGFSSFIFGGAGGRSESDMFGRCNREYIGWYLTERRYLIDPVARRVTTSWLPVAWEVRDYLDDEEETCSELFKFSSQVGYERGISTPIFGPNGRRRVLVAIYGAEAPMFKKCVDQLCDELMIVGHHLASAHCRLTQEREPGRALSPRERECLSWTFNGKTAWEVSRIIGVSERTVHFHVQNAMAKLDASSKHHACLKAVQLGIIPN